MSKYFVIKSSNSNVKVESEWSNVESAKVAYHDTCKILWNAMDVIKGVVELVDDNLNLVDGYKEHIEHPEPEVAGE